MKFTILILSSAAMTLAGPIIPTMVYDLPTISTSTTELLPTPTEDVYEPPWPMVMCARGEPPSRYPHGCCDWVAGNCIPRFNDPPDYLEHEPEGSEISARALADPIIPTMVPASELLPTPTSTDEPLPTIDDRGGEGPLQMRICHKETQGQPHIPCIQQFSPPDEYPDPPTSTSTAEPRPTTIEEILEDLPHLPACALGGPPSRYSRGCCDYVAGNCIIGINPSRFLEQGPKETEVAGAK